MVTNAMFTSVLPKSTVMNSRRGSSRNRTTAALPPVPSLRILWTWVRVNAERAVSDPEKKAEQSMSRPTPTT